MGSWPMLPSSRASISSGVQRPSLYTAVGSKIAVWNQPVEVRAMFTDGRWTPEEIEARLDGSVGQERMRLIDQLEAMRQAASSGDSPTT